MSRSLLFPTVGAVMACLLLPVVVLAATAGSRRGISSAHPASMTSRISRWRDAWGQDAHG